MQDISRIPTERLLPNPYQPRHKFDSEEMLELADSIKENGILQPLLIRRINNSEYYEVIAGERRLRGAILANMQTVPCVVLECDTENSAMISILENIQRSDLTFFEEATALGQLVNHFGLSQSQVAKRLGKSQTQAERHKEKVIPKHASGDNKGSTSFQEVLPLYADAYSIFPINAFMRGVAPSPNT